METGDKWKEGVRGREGSQSFQTWFWVCLDSESFFVSLCVPVRK